MPAGGRSSARTPGKGTLLFWLALNPLFPESFILSAAQAGGAELSGSGADQLNGFTLHDFLPAPWKDLHVKHLKVRLSRTADSMGDA
jgi:hypothetical protein